MGVLIANPGYNLVNEAAYPQVAGGREQMFPVLRSLRSGVLLGGLEGVGGHRFRHTYRSWLDDIGAPIGVQLQLMRPAQPSTTLTYGNALMKSKCDANSKVVRIALRSAEKVA